VKIIDPDRCCPEEADERARSLLSLRACCPCCCSDNRRYRTSAPPPASQPSTDLGPVHSASTEERPLQHANPPEILIQICNGRQRALLVEHIGNLITGSSIYTQKKPPVYDPTKDLVHINPSITPLFVAVARILVRFHIGRNSYLLHPTRQRSMTPQHNSPVKNTKNQSKKRLQNNYMAQTGINWSTYYA
jgi:hypothetical protein